MFVEVVAPNYHPFLPSLDSVSYAAYNSYHKVCPCFNPIRATESKVYVWIVSWTQNFLCCIFFFVISRHISNVSFHGDIQLYWWAWCTDGIDTELDSWHKDLEWPSTGYNWPQDWNITVVQRNHRSSLIGPPAYVKVDDTNIIFRSFLQNFGFILIAEMTLGRQVIAVCLSEHKTSAICNILWVCCISTWLS